MGAQHGAGRNRCALKPRQTLIPPVLFALAFFGSLLVLRSASPIAPVLLTVRYVVRPGVPEPVRLAPVVVEELAHASEEQPPEIAAEDDVDVTDLRESLRLASADEDEDVAARAQEEYEALVERDER